MSTNLKTLYAGMETQEIQSELQALISEWQRSGALMPGNKLRLKALCSELTSRDLPLRNDWLACVESLDALSEKGP